MARGIRSTSGAIFLLLIGLGMVAGAVSVLVAYLPDGDRDLRAYEAGNPWYQDETRFAWIHTSQLGADGVPFDTPIEHLRDVGLAVNTRFDPLTRVRDDFNWVGMHLDPPNPS